MEVSMEQTLIACQTDKGRFAVRPISWAGIFDIHGNIKEEGLNHTAIFMDEKDAQWYVKIMNKIEKKEISKQTLLNIIQNH